MTTTETAIKLLTALALTALTACVAEHVKNTSTENKPLLFLAAPPSPMTDSATRSTFGYGSVRTDGISAYGNRPVAIVLIDFADRPFDKEHTVPYYRELFFTNPDMNLGGLYREMSHGLFSFHEGAIIGPIRAVDNPATACNEATRACAMNDWIGTMARTIPTSSGVHNWSSFDVNRDRTLSPADVQIVAVDAGGGDGGTTGYLGCTEIPSLTGPLSACAQRASIGEGASVHTLAHELGHSLGISYDMYNDTDVSTDSEDMGLMTGYQAVHMDPYNRMRLGWVVPAAFDLAQGAGTCRQQINETLVSARPVLLYDSRRGTSEYFMLENRVRAGFDTGIASEGVAVWHVKIGDDGYTPFQIRGRVLGPGANGRLDSVRDSRDTLADMSPWGAGDRIMDTIMPGADGVQDSIAVGDDNYSLRNVVLMRGAPTTAGAEPDLGGNRAFTYADGWFRLQWINSAHGAPVALADAGISLRVGRRLPDRDWVGVQWWSDKDPEGLPVDTESIRDCLDDVKTVAGGAYHSCALTNEGRAYCWGSSVLGALGNGGSRANVVTSYDGTRRIPTAVAVMGGYRFSQIDAGLDSTCGVLTDGRLACWGNNSFGQLGLGDTANRNTPTIVALSDVTSVSMGEANACAIVSGGTLYCWGKNLGQQLGIGNSQNQTRPARVSSLNKVTAVSLGQNSSCAINASGQLFCWGSNPFGQLGLGDTTTRSYPTRVTTLENVTKVAVGSAHACALVSSGEVYCFGGNKADGLLGNGSGARSTRPTLAAISGVTDLSAGYFHTCAVASGAMYCWGALASGALGSTARQFFPFYVPGSENPSKLDAGAFHTLLLRADGQLRATGWNIAGQLGDGRTADRYSLISVTAL